MAAAMRLALAGLCLLTFAMAGALPVGAAAPESATVSVVKRPVNWYDEVTLVYRAGASEANQLTIEVIDNGCCAPPGWLVRETGINTATQKPIALVAGPGCTKDDTQTARCGYSSPQAGLYVDANLGDKNDTGSVANACKEPDEDYVCHAVVKGGKGDDILRGNHIRDAIRGVLHGGRGADRLYAGVDGSLMIGDLGNDQLFGARGNDVLLGREGRDQLRGGRGTDQLQGGDDNDTFYARDDTRDVVRGGGGTDRARLDARDDASSIERRF